MNWPWSKNQNKTEEDLVKASKDLQRKTMALELDIKRTEKIILGFDFKPRESSEN